MQIRADELKVGMRVKTFNPANNMPMVGVVEDTCKSLCMSLEIRLDSGSILSIPRNTFGLWTFEEIDK